VSGKPIFTDRTRIETYETCPRKRWWLFEVGGRGLEPVRLVAWPLLTGSLIHKGIEMVLKGTPLAPAIYHLQREYEDAVRDYLDALAEEARPTEAAEFRENLDLVEALVRGWIAVGLPRLLADYEILAVEQEGQATFLVDGCEIALLTRSDLIVKRLTDGVPLLVNFKSVADPSSNWREQWRYDVQTFSEVLAVEQQLGEKLGGVIVEGLVKGKRLDYPQGSGQWYFNSPLTHCWYRSGEAELGTPEWAPRYEWVCAEPHGRCPGGATHRLGKGFRKVRVSEAYPGGVEAWLAYLLGTDRELVEQQFLQLPPILRSDYDIDEWRTSALPREVEIHRAAALADAAEGVERLRLLRRSFPKHTAHGNCLRPSKCAAFELCWGTAAEEPLLSGFQWRVPNHPAEVSER